MQSSKTSALAVLVVTAIAGIYTLVAGNEPLLGLDLQGGVSVVLQPTPSVDRETGDEVELSDEALDQTVEIIRSRVDALGVAEPEIARQGDTIIVDLPGIDEHQRALDLVGQTAELRFRPVVFDLGPSLADLATDATTGDDDADGDAGDGSEGSGGGGEDPSPSDDDDDPAADGDDPGSDSGTTDDSTSDAEESGAGDIVPIGLAATSTTADEASADETSTTGVSDDDGDETTSTAAGTAEQEGEETTPSTTAGDDDGDTTSSTTAPAGEQSTVSPGELDIITACSISDVTPPEQDFAEDPVVLVDRTGNRLCLGPTLLTGEALETAWRLAGSAGTVDGEPDVPQRPGGDRRVQRCSPAVLRAGARPRDLPERPARDRARPRGRLEPDDQRPDLRPRPDRDQRCLRGGRRSRSRRGAPVRCAADRAPDPTDEDRVGHRRR